jgi:hypothetical protein
MGVFISKDKNPYQKLRDLALLQNAKEPDPLPVDENEPYKVLVEFYVSGTPVSVFCAIDGTASIYLGSGSGFINGGMENETIRQIAKSIVFESKNILDSLEPMKMFPVVQDGWINVFVVTERNIYGINASQETVAQKASEIWEIYYLAIEIISMYMNS